MRILKRRVLGIHSAIRLGIQAAIGFGIGISGTAAPGQDLEPSCLAPPGAEEIRWTRGPETDRVRLDRWCAAVGAPLLRRAGEEAPVPGADDLLVTVWNVQLGAGAVPTLVADLRAGRLTAGEPVRHFVLLLQEVHRVLVDGPACPPSAALTARRIAPMRRCPDVLSVARELDLHLL